jgi:hypothetical protein
MSIQAALARADSNDEDALRQARGELQRADPQQRSCGRLRKRGYAVPRGPDATRENPRAWLTRELEVLALVAGPARLGDRRRRVPLRTDGIPSVTRSCANSLSPTGARPLPRPRARAGVKEA